MADPTFTYDTGLVTIATGSASVTGNGTGWEIARILAGDLIVSGGIVGLVDIVTDDTTIELADPWAGADETDAVYTILYTSPLRYSAPTTAAWVNQFLQAVRSASYLWVFDGAPDSSLGGAGQKAVDVSTSPWTYYERDTGAWVEISNPNAGPTGDTGATGATGQTGPGYLATSSSSLSIGTGEKTVATQAGLAYTPGARVRLAATADPAAAWMEGVVTSYTGTTLVVDVDLTTGAMTDDDWTINLAGERGATGAPGIDGVDGNDGWSPTGPDLVQYGTGVGTVAETALSAAGRALIGGASAAEQATLLGVRYPDNAISGLGLANNVSDATNDIDISTGWCADATNAKLIVLASALTKRLDASWAVGTNQGGLDTGSVANGTYHVFLIERSDTGVVDALFSVSPSAPTMPTHYDYKRRIGSIIRSGGAILAFVQDGDDFALSSPIIDLNASANPGTSAVLRTLSVPTGIRVTADISVTLNTQNLGAAGLITDPATADSTPSSARCNFFTAAVGSGIANLSGASLRRKTNTSAQVRSRITSSDANTYLSITTFGWTDTRGRA